MTHSKVAGVMAYCQLGGVYARRLWCELRGWNPTGWPTYDKLVELGLGDVADELDTLGRLGVNSKGHAVETAALTEAVPKAPS